MEAGIMRKWSVWIYWTGQIRQSGILDFKLGDVFQDAEILKCAKEAVDKYEQMFYNESETRQIEQYLERYISERAGQLQL